MHTVRLLLVSTFLFYNKISGPEPNATGDDVFMKRTVLEPYMSMYNSLPLALKKKHRNVLTATLKINIREPFTSNTWNSIENLKTIKKKMKYIDNWSPVYDISANLQKLVSRKINQWLLFENRTVSSIEYYIGFKPKTIDLITKAMTELVSQDRKGKIILKQFLMNYYYIFDIKNVVVDDTPLERTNTTIEKLNIHYHNLDAQLLRDSNKENDVEIIGKLFNSIEKINKKAHFSCVVSIPSMKLWLLTKSTSIAPLKTIQNLKPFAVGKKTLKDYANMYIGQFDAVKIMEYHSKLLSVLITHLFGFVVNHFELLSELYSCQLDSKDKTVIQEFSPFMDGYMSIFIERYFAFNGVISQEIVDVMFPIIFFLNTYGESQRVKSEFLSEEEKTQWNSFPGDKELNDSDINEESDITNENEDFGDVFGEYFLFDEDEYQSENDEEKQLSETGRGKNQSRTDEKRKSNEPYEKKQLSETDKKKQSDKTKNLNISLENYYNRQLDVNKNMKELIDNAVRVLLLSFSDIKNINEVKQRKKKDASNSIINDWNQDLKINILNKTKTNLLDEIKKNNSNAFLILKEFHREFTIKHFELGDVLKEWQ